ncbi:MAG: hypothetical protein ACPLSN_06655 [Dictyoglomus turgidum]
MEFIEEFVKHMEKRRYKKCQRIIKEIQSLPIATIIECVEKPLPQTVLFIPYLDPKERRILRRLIRKISKYIGKAQVERFDLLSLGIRFDERFYLKLFKKNPHLVSPLIRHANESTMPIIVRSYLTGKLLLTEENLIEMLKKISQFSSRAGIFGYIEDPEILSKTIKISNHVIDALSDNELFSIINKLVFKTKGPTLLVEKSSIQRLMSLAIVYPELIDKIKIIISFSREVS